MFLLLSDSEFEPAVTYVPRRQTLSGTEYIMVDSFATNRRCYTLNRRMSKNNQFRHGWRRSIDVTVVEVNKLKAENSGSRHEN